MDGPRVEMPQPKSTEVRYPGFRHPLREVTTSPSDVARINKINTSLDASEYAETGEETSEETLAWLKGGSTRLFSSIDTETPKRNIIGVGRAIPSVSSDITIGFSNSMGELSSYTYVYDHKSPIADRMPAPKGNLRKEISFVTDLPDSQRSLVEITEAMQQTAMMLWEVQAGKTTSELTGSFTPAELEQAKRLEILTTAGNGEDETNYRKGLEEAGFMEIGNYDEDGLTQTVYILHLHTLIAAMDEKKTVASQ